ncbi:MAG: carbon-nitrogen hydrolase family protein [Gemmatimonadaceae bacterium]
MGEDAEQIELNVKIALANLRYPSSPDESVTLAQSAIAEAARGGASVLCFPEVYVPGYRKPGETSPPLDVAFLERAWAAIARSAREANISVVLGTERMVEGEARITTLVINADGTTAGFQDKVQLDPTEEDFYAAGAGRRIFESGTLRFGISICHEGFRYPETVRWSARNGAHLVFHPHFSWAENDSFRPATFADSQNTFHEKAVLCRAAENTCFVASVNYATDGSPTTSVIVRPDGSVLAWQPYGVEGLLMTDIQIGEASGFLASRLRPA